MYRDVCKCYCNCNLICWGKNRSSFVLTFVDVKFDIMGMEISLLFRTLVWLYQSVRKYTRTYQNVPKRVPKCTKTYHNSPKPVTAVFLWIRARTYRHQIVSGWTVARLFRTVGTCCTVYSRCLRMASYDDTEDPIRALRYAQGEGKFLACG